MKQQLLGLLLLLFTLSLNTLKSQTESKQVETFKVWGNCGMCKKNIEKSLKIKGVSGAVWDKNTKMLTVTFQPNKITLAEIHKKIASVGYDTELETADDQVYNKLHGCCQYDRKAK